jgi:hypothetical protein
MPTVAAGFLKIIHDQDQEVELTKDDYQPPGSLNALNLPERASPHSMSEAERLSGLHIRTRSTRLAGLVSYSISIN